jgi:uncharacterized protein (DUF169 family)
MDMELKNRFVTMWRKYFNQTELPIIFYYSETQGKTELVKPDSVSRCVIEALAEVRKGRSLTFNASTVSCPGGKKYLGFSENLMPNFEYFLSCGVPGKMEGERYKKSPELVKEIIKNWPSLKASAPYITFKRWDNLEEEDKPEVVVFFAQPDALSGLFTLFNYDQSDPEGVITPMSSGCASIISYPLIEKNSARPRAVIGMFDPSARPMVAKDVLSFAVPLTGLENMLNNIEESFLITHTWQVLQKRIN